MVEKLSEKVRKSLFYLFFLLNQLLPAPQPLPETGQKKYQTEQITQTSLEVLFDKYLQLLFFKPFDFPLKDIDLITDKNESERLYKKLREIITPQNDQRRTISLLMLKVLNLNLKKNPNFKIYIGFFKGITAGPSEKEYETRHFAETTKIGHIPIILFNGDLLTEKKLGIPRLEERRIEELSEIELYELIRQNFVHELTHVLIENIMNQYLQKNPITLETTTDGIPTKKYIFGVPDKEDYEATERVFTPNANSKSLLNYVLRVIFDEKFFGENFSQSLFQIYETIYKNQPKSPVRTPKTKFYYFDEFLAYLMGFVFTDPESAHQVFSQKLTSEEDKKKFREIIQKIWEVFVDHESPLQPDQRKKLIF